MGAAKTTAASLHDIMSSPMDVDDSPVETTPVSSKRETPLQFDPMAIEYDLDQEELESCKKRIMQTLFPRNEFKDNEQREKYALQWHKHLECSTIKELVHRIAIRHLSTRYCHWCRDYDIEKTIIEHKHIKGNAGRYRGVLCRSCNAIEGYIKDLPYQEKIDHLYYKIGDRVYQDYKWILQCVYNWYK